MLEKVKNNSALVADMMHIENIMLDCVKNRHENVEQLLSNMILKGGKRLRPLFVILCSRFGISRPEEIYKVAAAIEMIHMATLIHDDIIDEAKVRRGQITAQSKLGKDHAVFLGDFLMNRSFMLLNGSSHTGDILQSTEKVFYGEMLQYNNRYKKNTSVTKYLRVAANKTASLFELSCHLGSKISNCDEDVSRRLRRIGYYFGLSFQITDDVLDFTSDEENLGKDVQNDLKMGFYTLPVIYTARKDLGVWDLIEEERYKEVLVRIKDLGGLNKTISLAQRYIEKAICELEPLPDIPEKEIICGLILHINKVLSNARQ
ncbi:MAG: polyprenyl synthetase family protein [Clostridiales bacterium]|nr:polyprenyl synthetase family protein [Clostridiales bacterium]